MSRFRFVVPSLLAISIAGTAYGQISKADNLPAKVVLAKNERAGTWQAPEEGVQAPLWPASTPLAKPDPAIGLRGPVMGRDLWEEVNGIGRAMSPGPQ